MRCGACNEISERGGKVYGKIVQLFREPSEIQDPVCKECDPTDDRFNKKVIGMEFIREMVRDDDEWTDGTILDPQNGKVYDCKLWVEERKLKVRGYVAFFYRTTPATLLGLALVLWGMATQTAPLDRPVVRRTVVAAVCKFDGEICANGMDDNGDGKTDCAAGKEADRNTSTSFPCKSMGKQRCW